MDLFFLYTDHILVETSFTFLGTDTPAKVSSPPLFFSAQIMRWDDCFGGLSTKIPNKRHLSLLLSQWLIDLTKTVYKAEKNRVGCHLSCLQALSVWFSYVLHTRTITCSQLNFNALLATTTHELHNIKVKGSCRTHPRHPNSAILLLINVVVNSTDFITAAPHAWLNLFLTFTCATCERSNGLFRFFFYYVSCICWAITSPKTTSQLLFQQRASITGLCRKDQLRYCRSQFIVNNSGCSPIKLLRLNDRDILLLGNKCYANIKPS